MIYQGDCLAVLRTLPARSVQCVVTSPPYWGLRDYGVDGQLGLESTPDAYCAAMVNVFAEVHRVLADDGVCWLNLGDSYNSGTQFNHHSSGLGDSDRYAEGSRDSWPGHRPLISSLKHKDLVGIPWRVAFALQAAGWYLRADVIWSKPNPMPESVQDRPTKAHEYIFLLTKSAKYFYDAAAIAERASEAMLVQIEQGYEGQATKPYDRAGVQNPSAVKSRIIERARSKQTQHKQTALGQQAGGYLGSNDPFLTRNKRSVWTVATQPFPGAHFATFPEDLIQPCILAGSRGAGKQPADVVLDPFCGSGTVGVVCAKAQRRFIGIELNPEYVAMAEARIADVAPLFQDLAR